VKFLVAVQLSKNDDDGCIVGNMHRFYAKYGTANHHIGDDYWHVIAANMRCSPTSGIAALHVLLQYPVKEVILTGFTFYDRNEDKKTLFRSPGYIKWGGEVDKSRPLRLHKIHLEREYFKNNLMQQEDRITVDSYISGMFRLTTTKVLNLSNRPSPAVVYKLNKTLAKLVNKKRVAIVGPSPHLMGEGVGKELDKYDTVCRVNELLPFGCEEDYGSRTDIIFHCCGGHSVPKLRDTLMAKPKVAKKVKLLVCTQDVQEDPDLGIPFHAVGHAYWMDMNTRVGIEASTGLLAVLLLLDQYNPKELLITGFSFYQQGLEPHQRHNPGYIKWGGDHSAKKAIPDNRLSQCTKRHQEPQKKFFQKLVQDKIKKIRLDSYLSGLLRLNIPNVLQLTKRVYAVYRVLYGADFLRESILSIINKVDKVFVFWTNKAFGDVTRCTYKGAVIQFPEKIDNVVQVAQEIQEQFPDKVEVIFDHWGVPDNQFTHLVNDRILPHHPKPDMVMFCEPDQIWREQQLELAFEEMAANGATMGIASQIELWRNFAWRVPERPKRISTVFWNLKGLSGVPTTGKSGQCEGGLRLKACVHNLGFCINPETMFWKHMLAIGFSQIIKDSEPNEDWYFGKWLTWNSNGNNKDLEIAKGRESNIPHAVRYDRVGLPEVLKA
jgi:hypothetical protein